MDLVSNLTRLDPSSFTGVYLIDSHMLKPAIYVVVSIQVSPQRATCMWGALLIMWK